MLLRRVGLSTSKNKEVNIHSLIFEINFVRIYLHLYTFKIYSNVLICGTKNLYQITFPVQTENIQCELAKSRRTLLSWNQQLLRRYGDQIAIQVQTVCEVCKNDHPCLLELISKCDQCVLLKYIKEGLVVRNISIMKLRQLSKG